MSRKKLIFTAIILALVLLIGGVLAYFTDTQTKTNSFTMGNVDIEVNEGNFPEGGIENVTPGIEYEKSPKIINKGTTPVYAFVKVSIPYRNISVGGAQAADTELFELLHITDETQGTTAVGINAPTTTEAGWALVNVAEEGATDPVTSVKDTTKEEITYVYAFVDKDGKLKALNGKEGTVEDETDTLFDKIRFIDISESTPTNSQIQGQTFDVTVSGYGIQTSELGLTGDDATNPAKVWPLANR